MAGKSKKSSATVPEYDHLQYEAESQVMEALKGSPQVKKEVRRVKGELKKERARIKRSVLKNAQRR